MASTYVNNLRLNEMATGDGAGTWGTTTNTNLELIGEALGYGTEAITTNADTHTSTVADGSTDAARAMYIKYTGTLDSACTITIGPNTMKRVQFIENATSGSQNIIISQGSGANITIPPGDVKVVYLDGAGSGAAVVDAFASLSVVDLKVQDDLTVTDDLIVNGDIDLEGNMDVNGSLETDALSLNGTTVTSTAAELNILDGVTSTAAEINLLDGSSANTVVNSKAVIYGSSGEVAGTLSTAAQTNITSLGTLTTLTVDDITINGSTISDSGDLTLDVGGDIVLDANGADIKLKDNAVEFGRLSNTATTFQIYSPISDLDIAFVGNDGGSTITALTLDMSAAGAATFSSTITAGANSGVIKEIGSDLSLVQGAVGLRINDAASAISATTATANSDGAVDLGVSNIRFKRLYLTDGITDSGSAGSNTVFNDGGTTADFRVESTGNANMLFVDGGNDCVNIATATQLQSRTLTINGSTINTDGTNVYNQHVNIPYRGVGDGTNAGYLLLVPYKDGGSAINGGVVCGKFVASRGNTGSGNLFATCDVNVSATYLNTGATLETQGDDDYFQELSLVTFNSVVYVALKFAQTNGGAANGITFRGWSRQTDSNFLTMKLDSEVSSISSFKGPTTRIDRTAGMIVNPNGDDVDFRVESDGNANMLFVDGGNNEIGIGTNAPDTILHVHKGSAGSVTSLSDSTLVLENSTHNYLTFLSPNDKEQAIIFGDAQNNNSASVGYNHNTDNLSISSVDDIVFNTSGTTRGRFTDNGLCFNADTAAGNALDDYEEGTWTPATGPGSSQGYLFRSGNYTKVGRLVTAHFGLKHNAGTFTASEATISGLPFATIATGSFQEPMIILTTLGNAPTGVGGSGGSGALIPGEASFYLAGGESQGRGRKFTTNTDNVMNGDEIFDSNSFIKGTVIYYTS